VTETEGTTDRCQNKSGWDCRPSPRLWTNEMSSYGPMDNQGELANLGSPVNRLLKQRGRVCVCVRMQYKATMCTETTQTSHSTYQHETHLRHDRATSQLNH